MSPPRTFIVTISPEGLGWLWTVGMLLVLGFGCEGTQGGNWIRAQTFDAPVKYLISGQGAREKG